MRAQLAGKPLPDCPANAAFQSHVSGRNAVYLVQLMQENRLDQVYAFDWREQGNGHCG